MPSAGGLLMDSSYAEMLHTGRAARTQGSACCAANQFRQALHIEEAKLPSNQAHGRVNSGLFQLRHTCCQSTLAAA